MANTVIINVQANTAAATADITTTTVAVDNLTKSSKKLDTANKGTASSFEDVTKNGGAIAILDQLTGGLASRMRDTFEATKLFNFSLKGMRKAIIATGIGALVVAGGLLVAYWSDIVDYVKGTSRAIENQSLKYNVLNESASAYIAVLKAQKKLTEDEGKSTKEITRALRNKLIVQKLANDVRRKEIKQALKLKLSDELRKQLSKELYAGYLENFAISTDLLNLDKESLQVDKDKKALKDQAIIDAKKLAAIRNAELEEIRVGQIQTAKEIKEEEIRISIDKYNKLAKQAVKFYGNQSAEHKKILIAGRATLKSLKDKHAQDDLAAQKIIDDKKILAHNQLQTFLAYSSEEASKLSREMEFKNLTAHFRELRKAHKDDEEAVKLIDEAAVQRKKAIEDKHYNEDLEKRIARDQQLRDYTKSELELKRQIERTALLEQSQELEMLYKDDEDALLIIEEEYLQKKTDLKQKHADEDKAIENQSLQDKKIIEDAKKSLTLASVTNAGKAIGDLGRLFDEGTAASKAAAIAEIIIGTGIGYIQGLDIAQKSAKGTGLAAGLTFPVFYATQIAAVVGAAKQASNILKKVKGGGGGGVSATPPPIPPAQQPQFNIVGQGAGSQIASALGDQQQIPIQTYVVSQDVTTAQSLENGIISGATLGG